MKGKNYKSVRDYYFNFQFSVMFLSISRQTQFTGVFIFKIVILTVVKPSSVLTWPGELLPTFIKYQVQGHPFHLHSQNPRGETPES